MPYTKDLAINGSWEFAEFCQKTGMRTDNETSQKCSAIRFEHSHPEIVAGLVQRREKNYVTCGTIANLSEYAGVYSCALLDPLSNESIAATHIPEELLAGKKYTPRNGDKITHIVNKETGEVSLSLRQDGKDVELFRLSKEDHEKAIDAAQKRIDELNYANSLRGIAGRQ